MTLFDLPPVQDFVPVYNIAPSFRVLAAHVKDEKVALDRFSWNYRPHWAKQNMKSVINARVETVFEKPYFRGAIKYHRCLVPATGFYEWKPPEPGEKGKTPVFIHPENMEEGFLLAGLYDGEGMAICTREASEKMSRIHDRMPVIVAPGDAEAWLRSQESAEVKEVLSRALDVDHAFPVSREVNSPAANSAELLEPAGQPYF